MKDLRLGRRSLPCWLVLLSLQPLFGCTLINDVSEHQCSTKLDCQRRGATFADSVCVDGVCQADPKWACSDQVRTEASQAAVHASISVISMVNYGPLPDIHLVLCGSLDLLCMVPLAEGDTDATGKALLAVPSSFDGYIRAESPKFVPMLFFPNLPVTEGGSLGEVVLSPQGSIEALAGQLGDVAMPGRGLVVTRITDCQMQIATGASVEFVGNMTGSHSYYALDGIPSDRTTVTDSTGMAAAMNVLPGTVGINIKFGTRIVAQVSVTVRDGYMTYRPVQLGDL